MNKGIWLPSNNVKKSATRMYDTKIENCHNTNLVVTLTSDFKVGIMNICGFQWN